MFDYIKGSIEEITPTQMVIECNGIGYAVLISLQTYDKIKSDKIVKLYIYHHIREDEETLFGFYDKDERTIFIQLISVSGIGPNSARMMLSSLTTDEVRNAILTSDVNKIKSVKGIGLKTAQKVIIELKSKIGKSDSSCTIPGTCDNQFRSEACTALVLLGFNKIAVEKVVDSILKKEQNLQLEIIIKKALKLL
jgi:holliday junction DNA helicase RuvA